MSAILGVAAFEYLPYMWLSFTCIIIAVIFGFTGWFMWDNSNDVRMSSKNSPNAEMEI